ncbi:MAG: type II methionyl aminopeptidase [Candidatus Lokiarchaeota archaeon]|nr:type II methionyl aminopeptidase [Candidatus Lokiarchaeota archaeon]
MTENENLKSETEEEKSKEELDKEKEEKFKIESLQKAGKIAQEVKKYIKPKIKVGAKVFDLISDTEAKIEELGGLCAFPVNFCINNIAAHYTSPIKDDGLEINEGDLVKIDLGVHIEGYIVDTAFSINFSEDESLENIIQATEVALDAAKMMVKPKTNTRDIGKKIEEIIKGFKYNPIRELGGHQIERWTVHGKKKLPELGSQGGDVMETGEVFSIEIFASTGDGSVHNTQYSYIYEINPYAGRVPLRRKTSKQLLGFINKNYKTLPFADRWLAKEFRLGVAFGLQELIQQGKLQVHHVLAAKKSVNIAQIEESILITEDGFEQLT